MAYPYSRSDEFALRSLDVSSAVEFESASCVTYAAKLDVDVFDTFELLGLVPEFVFNFSTLRFSRDFPQVDGICSVCRLVYF